MALITELSHIFTLFNNWHGDDKFVDLVFGGGVHVNLQGLLLSHMTECSTVLTSSSCDHEVEVIDDLNGSRETLDIVGSEDSERVVSIGSKFINGILHYDMLLSNGIKANNGGEGVEATHRFVGFGVYDIADSSDCLASKGLCVHIGGVLA